MGTPAQVPELRDEINRKAFETIEKITRDDQSGRITKGQFAYAVDVLWSVVSGLVEKDITIMMEVMGNTPDDGSFFTRTYLRDAKGNIAKVTNLHDGRVRFELIPIRHGEAAADKIYDFRPEIETMKCAKNKELAIIDILIAKGYEEI